MDKFPALTISSWITKAIYLLIIILSIEVNSQTVSLDSSGIGKVSNCSSGLINGTDFYLFTGTVDATAGKYSNLVDFKIKAASSSAFTTLCTVPLTPCFTPNTQPCYCAKQNGNIYEIVANRSAVLTDSEASIRIQWDSLSGASAYSSILNVAKIFDLNAVTRSLTVNGNLMNCPETSQATVTLGTVITFKCQNSPSPCDVSIAINNIEIIKSVGEATYKVDGNLTSSNKFTFSYSVCGGGKRSCDVVLVTVPGTCALNCTAWAIALSVIFYFAILVIIFTGIVILVLAIKDDKKTLVFYLSIGFLVFAEVLDVILIIVFAQAEPCTCDTNLALWKIMLIIFCIINGLLIIAVVVVLIWIYCFPKSSKQHTGPNRGSADITPHTDVSAPNTRTQKENKGNNVQNANTLSKINKGKTDNTYELQEEEKTKLPNTPDELKKDEAVNNVKGESENKKGKKKKSKKKNKETKEQEKESSSTNRSLPLPLSGNKKLLPIHSQAPTGTKLDTYNPYG